MKRVTVFRVAVPFTWGELFVHFSLYDSPGDDVFWHLGESPNHAATVQGCHDERVVAKALELREKLKSVGLL